jgi:hypothetical protein
MLHYLCHLVLIFGINIVILVHTDLKTNRSCHNILFSTDLELSYQKIVH